MSADALNARFEPIGVPDERAIKQLMGDWRNGRADRTFWAAVADSYVMVFSVVVLGAMIGSAILDAQRSASSCDSAGCLAGRGLLPWAAAAGILALTLVFSRMFGPVLASSAEGFWLMDSPMDRRRLLRGRFAVAIILSGLISAVVAALVSALSGQTLTNVGVWSLSAGLGAAGLTAFAGMEQTYERRWLVITVQWLLGLSAAAALGALVAAAAGWIDVPPSVSSDLALIVGGVGLVLLIACGASGFLRLRNIRRQRLTSGGSLLSGLQGAAFALEFALIRDILVENKCKEKGHVRPTRGSGSGTRALMLRDVQRLLRSPLNLVVLLITMVVPYAVLALGLQALNVAISGIVLMAALIPFMNSLRVVSRTKGLARAFPFAPAQLRRSLMVVPGILALVWAAGTLPAFAGVTADKQFSLVDGLTPTLVAAIAGFLGAVRWVSAKPANYNGPLVATGTGAMPPGLMFSMIRGFDMIALVTFPLLFGLPAWVSMVIAAIAFFFLSSGLDQEGLMEQSKEQQRLLEEEKAKARGSKEKIRVQRGKR